MVGIRLNTWCRWVVYSYELASSGTSMLDILWVSNATDWQSIIWAVWVPLVLWCSWCFVPRSRIEKKAVGLSESGAGFFVQRANFFRQHLVLWCGMFVVVQTSKLQKQLSCFWAGNVITSQAPSFEIWSQKMMENIRKIGLWRAGLDG